MGNAETLQHVMIHRTNTSGELAMTNRFEEPRPGLGADQLPGTYMKRALIWFQAVREARFEGITTTHASAETRATLTTIPGEPRIE